MSGHSRQTFIFTNYLDRVTLATIRDKGLCPCPRCLVPKSELDQTGTMHDRSFRLENVRIYLFNAVKAARKAIYKKANAITGVAVNKHLKETSSVPTLVSKSLLAVLVRTS